MMMKIGVMMVLWLSAGVCGQGLDSVLLHYEEAVKRLANDALSAHIRGCQALRAGDCGCSVPACGTEFGDDFRCDEAFGTDTDACRGVCKGVVKSTEQSALRVALSSDTGSTDLRGFVCASNNLQAFKTNTEVPNIKYNSQLLGHRSGVMRVFPGFAQPREAGRQCSSYDPRIRPWYVAAASGPKDIVLVLDASGSMSEELNTLTGETRMAAVQVAVGGVLDTLTQNDFVSIVTFNNRASVLGGGDTLLRATPDNLELLKGYMNGVTGEGGTHFTTGLQKAFELFNRSFAAETGGSSGCQRVVLFLSDGKDDQGDADLISRGYVDNLQAELAATLNQPGQPVRIFTYSIANPQEGGAAYDIPKDLACAHGGLWEEVSASRHPFDALTSYFQFLAAGIRGGEVRWSNPYEDAFGLGTVITAAYPYYEEVASGVKRLVGVAGIDAQLSLLEQYGSRISILNDLMNRARACPVVSLDFCQMQQLRRTAGFACPARSGQTCSDAGPANTCAITGSLNDLLCQPMNSNTGLAESDDGSVKYEDLHCCSVCSSGLSKGAVVGIVVAVVVTLIVVAALTFIFYRRRQEKLRAMAELQREHEMPRPSAPPADV